MYSRFVRFLPLALASIAICVSAAAAAKPGTFDVRAYGATGDGKTLDTNAVNRAIAAAAAAGGGTVVFPAGTYACYSLRLQSNVALQLDMGSTLMAAEPASDLTAGYDAPEPNPGTEYYEDFGHSHWHNSLIWGENLENVSITGPGRIYGFGLSKGEDRRDLLPEERRLAPGRQPDVSLPRPARETIAAQKSGPFGYPGKDTLPAGVGNKAIALKNCRNVVFRDFTIYHGGHFAILGTGVANWTIDNLKIDTNRDGMDLDCCQDVRVSNCTVNSPNDDGICPKSSYALGSPRPTENITITNCQVSGFDEGTLLDGTRQRTEVRKNGTVGRIKCGTESNGGFRNIVITNCTFEHCRGLALEAVDGALMEDIAISNLTMRDIANAPIFVRLGARLRGPDGTRVGTARRITISNVVASSVGAQSGILISGLADHPIEDLTLDNIVIAYTGGGTREQARRIVPELETDYPEPSNFGVMPAWALWARHVRGLHAHNLQFRLAADDQRPAVILQDVAGGALKSIELPPASDHPMLVLRDVSDLGVER